MSRPETWRRDVVEAINLWQQISTRIAGGRMADALLMDHGYTEDEADAALEDAADERLIDYGVSARTGWLTDKGRRLLHEKPDDPA